MADENTASVAAGGFLPKLFTVFPLAPSTTRRFSVTSPMRPALGLPGENLDTIVSENADFVTGVMLQVHDKQLNIYF